MIAVNILFTRTDTSVVLKLGEAGYPEAIIPLKDGNGLKVDISGLTPLLEELITKQGATEQTMNRIKTLLERVARLDKGAISVMQVA